MKNLDCNQIKIFINLEIIREEDKNKKKKIYINILKSKKNFYNLVKLFSTTMTSKKNFFNLVNPLGVITISKPNFY